MKKFLPLILAGAGVIVLVAGFFLVKGKSKPQEVVQQEESTTVKEVALNDRPITSLTPTSDGHFLNLKIEKIKVPDATTMDYEFIYQLPDGRAQGSPGTVTLTGQDKFERKLLLGSESSGKFRYDVGVKQGTLTLRFRNSGGKLLAKFATDFALLSASKELTLPDGSFKVTLSKLPQNAFFVLMQTFGVPDSPPKEVVSGPYGIFSSTDLTKLSGSVKIGDNQVYMHVTGPRWEVFADNSALSSDSGIFVGTSK